MNKSELLKERENLLKKQESINQQLKTNSEKLREIKKNEIDFNSLSPELLSKDSLIEDLQIDAINKILNHIKQNFHLHPSELELFRYGIDESLIFLFQINLTNISNINNIEKAVLYLFEFLQDQSIIVNPNKILADKEIYILFSNNMFQLHIHKVVFNFKTLKEALLKVSLY